MRFWNSLAAFAVVPFTTRFDWTILLMPFRRVLAIWPALGLVAWVQRVMICHVFDVIPLLDIDRIVEALTVQLQDVGSAALYCPREAPTRVLFLALINSGLGHTAFVGVIVIWLFLAGACSAFCNLGLVAIACLLLLVVVLLMLIGLTGCAWLAIVVLWGMRGTWFLSVLPLLLYSLGTQACSQVAQTP